MGQMKEFGVETSWTHLVNVSFEYLQTQCLDFYFTPLPFCMFENGDILMLLDFDLQCQAILYNPADNRLKHVKLKDDNVYWTHTKFYVESLVSPN